MSTLSEDYYTARNLPHCGPRRREDGETEFVVWAPRADSVELVLYRENGEQRIPMRRENSVCGENGGYFRCSAADAGTGRRYAFALDGKQPLPDPASRWQPEGVHRPSAVYFPEDFTWSDHAWCGVTQAELILYEIHIGTFSDEGTCDAAISRLPALQELGVTAVEVMPLSQFPGERGWGYDGVHPFAVQNSYGGPEAFQRFVDACHRSNLAVILDVVFNHWGPEGNYTGLFAPYVSSRYHTPWGDAVNFDDRGSDSVRRFVLDNVRYWLRDFHLDGLRLDAVHEIYDGTAMHILREIKSAAESCRVGRPVHIIAESDLHDVRLLDAPERGGFGLDAQWNDDFHHAVHVALTGESGGYYADFSGIQDIAKVMNSTLVYDGCYSAFRDRRLGGPAGDHPRTSFVVSIQNHDQIGNRAEGERLAALLQPAQLRLAASLLLLSPFVPLLFMGEEYGERRPFPFFCSFLDPQLVQAVREGRKREFSAFEWVESIPDPQSEETYLSAKIAWDWETDATALGLRRLYRHLIAFRKMHPAMKDFRNHHAACLESKDRGVLQIDRGSTLRMLFNFTPQTAALPPDVLKNFKILFSSEEKKFCGAAGSEEGGEALKGYECRVAEKSYD
jgi:maltooligosyltrehalose trehalohydrolase